MKKKSEKLLGFIHGLHDHIVNNRQFRKNTAGRSEVQIQTEIRPLIVDYLKEWFRAEGVVDFEGKAHDSFYWEGQEGRNKDKRKGTFGAFGYPDFIISEETEKGYPGFVNLIGIESPGLTSSPAIAKYVKKLLKN